MTLPTETQHTDAFQLTLNKILALKPQESIHRLLEILLPLSEKMIARRPRDFRKNGAEIYLLTEGHFWLHRKQDNLELSMAKAPHIFGLAELVLPFGDTTYVRFSPESEVFVVSGQKVQNLCQQQPALWEDVSKVLAFHLHFSTWRDLHLLNDSAYDTVRGKLLELECHDAAFRQSQSILNFILSTTKLSRSTVLRILKDLTDGGYIEAQRGKLINIVHLPLRY
jgi:CRP-like cAMP-binding protein